MRDQERERERERERGEERERDQEIKRERDIDTHTHRHTQTHTDTQMHIDKDARSLPRSLMHTHKPHVCTLAGRLLLAKPVWPLSFQAHTGGMRCRLWSTASTR